MKKIYLFTIMAIMSFWVFSQKESRRYYFQERNIQNTGISFTALPEIISKEEIQGEIFFNLKLRMTIKNTGNQDIIFLVEDPWREVLFASDTYINAFQGKYIHEENMGFSNDSTSETWKQRRIFLDTHFPPNEMTMILKKGESRYFSVELPLSFKRTYSIKRPREEEREILWIEAESIKTLYLRIVFHAWNANLEEGWYSAKSKFGKKLQKRWMNKGRLYLTDIITDPFEVNVN